MTKPVLASLIHDTGGDLVAPLNSFGAPLGGLFGGLALSITEPTDARVVKILEADYGAIIVRHRVGEDIIGRARRSAVALAIKMGAERIFYADFDSILRWVMSDQAELASVLARDDPFAVVGRSAAALSAWPERLQQTEGPINHTYALMTGQEADLLAAARSMSRDAAKLIVEHAREEGVGNDVEWPLLAAHFGVPVSHIEVGGLSYRTIEEFSADSDTLDGEPLQWIRRIEFAAEQARAMRRFLRP